MSEPILVVMAAGLGSRYGGLKQIDPIGPSGQIIMNYSVYDAYQAGFRRVIFIIKEELLESFQEKIGKDAEKLMEVTYVFQSTSVLPPNTPALTGRTKPLGTGHAVYCLRGSVDAPFAVINADDFYGRDAFEKIFQYLKYAQDDEKYRYCMVSYQIENTLTDNGTVSRGVCTTDNHGMLTNIIERTAISRKEDGKIHFEADGDATGGEIPDGTPVSMNVWGFTPSFLTELERLFQNFLTQDLPKNPLTAEFYLPFAVEALLKEDKATVQVLTTDTKWFGITYLEDKPVIVEAVQKMTEKGLYPA